MKNFQAVLCVVLALILIVAALPLGGVRAAGMIYYVNANASGSNNGSSWANAYTSLQSAIAVATSGDQIWVAAGTYKPTANINRQLSFAPKSGVALYGGFAGTETLLSQRNWNNNVTILSGDIGAQNVLKDNSFHVVALQNADAVSLDGFTITAGNANSTGTKGFGGGIWVDASHSVVLKNLIITNNNGVVGGGILAALSNSLKLENLKITNNNATNSGGGFHNIGCVDLTLTLVTFTNNSSVNGGGMTNVNANPSLTKVTFTGNSATETGGGFRNMADNGDSHPTLTNVIFSGNSASEGGGMINQSYAEWDGVAFAQPHLTNVNFNGNTATHTGGGMQNSSYSPPDFEYWGGLDPILTNVNFVGNSAGIAGGGMENHFHAVAHLTNVTFSGNSAPMGGGMSNTDSREIVLQNVTFNKNSASSTGGWLYNENGGLSFTHVTASGNTSSGDHCGINNVTAQPSFVNSIFWGNGTEYCSSSKATFVNSVIQGGCPTGSVCTQIINADPFLDVLKNNGGFTKTMALGSNSSALDIGNLSKCSVSDQRGVERPQGPLCDAGAYEKEQLSIIFNAEATHDGWILEAHKGYGNGGSMNIVSPLIFVGDDDLDRQYRGFFSFNTASLSVPSGAVLMGARLKLKSQGIVGTNPFDALGDIVIDIANGSFGNSPAMQWNDFKAQAGQDAIGRITNLPQGPFYTKAWSKDILPYINTSGLTQLRLRFAKSTNNDLKAYTLNFYSGNAVNTADRPQLIIYYLP